MPDSTHSRSISCLEPTGNNQCRPIVRTQLNRKLTLQRQLDQFRSAQPHRAKIPEAMWQAAVELALQHGLYAMAHPMRLDYVGIEATSRGVTKFEKKKKRASPRSVELIAAPPVAAECLIEFESKSGSKMRIQ